MSQFVLYPDIALVKGASRSTMMDFRSHRYLLISNEIASFLQVRKVNLEGLEKEDREFVDYLVEQDYGLVCEEDEANQFTEINTQWDYPADIQNAIVEIDPMHCDHLPKVFAALQEHHCEYVEVRLKKEIEEDALLEILKLMGQHELTGIELVMPYQSFVNSDFLMKVRIGCGVYLYKIALFDAPDSDELPEKIGITRLTYKPKKISCQDCGNICKSRFLVDIPFYAEAQKYNTCLNRKVSFSAEGEIKNCPSMQQSFGNIEQTDLKDVLQKGEFTSVWNTSKDKVDTCKDCEFRYMCTDCRAFVEGDGLSKPSKCTYDPYTGEWA